MNLVHLLLRSARWLPERPALAVGKRPLRTYREMACRVAGISTSLKTRFSLERGDRVALAADPNSRFYQLLRTGMEEVLV